MRELSRRTFISKRVVALARNRGMSSVDIRKIERLVFEYQAFLLEKYDDFQSE